MTRRWVAVCVVALMMVGAVQSHAQEAKKEEKKDPKAAKVDGTWKWSFTRQNGQTMESTLKLKREGEKLTGAVVGRQGRETAIGDAKIAADGTISFTVTREFNGNSFTQKYEGKVEGDTIKGKISGERQGQAFSRDWEAKRAADASGTWRLERTLDNGQTFTATLRLKQEGEKVTGTTQWADREPVEIEEGKIEGSKLTFQVTRENDGQKWTAKYDAEVTADAIKGTVTAGNDQGEERSWEMEYTRVKE